MSAFADARSIEQYYRTEQRRITESVESLEFQKARAYLGLTKKNYARLKQKKKKLVELHSALKSHLSEVSAQLRTLKRRKDKEDDTLHKIERLTGGVKALMEEEKSIRQTRKMLLAKEKSLQAAVHKSIAEEAATLSSLSVKRTKKIKQVEDSLDYLLSETEHFLTRETREAAGDVFALTEITETARARVQLINKTFADLNRKKRELLEKGHLLEVDEDALESQLEEIKKKKEALEQKVVLVLKNGAKR